MTIAELIAKLQTLPQDATVILAHSGDAVTVKSVAHFKKENAVGIGWKSKESLAHLVNDNVEIL